MEKSYYYNETRATKNVRVELEAQFSDPCEHAYNRFSFIANIWERNPETNRLRRVSSGWNHDYIAKYFPEIAKFLPLQVCDGKGRPLYYINNSLYWLKKDVKKGAEYLNIDEATAEAIKSDCEHENIFNLESEDKVIKFTEILNKYGIIEKWKALADECLAWFKEKEKTV